MINTLLVVFFVLLFIFIIGRLFVYPYYHTYWGPQGPDEVTTHTTTTTTVTEDVPAAQPSYNIVGNLVRQWEGTQPYVIDPVDHDRVWLNTSDDMYEDGAGKIWTLS
jgi:hypothetical protein